MASARFQLGLIVANTAAIGLIAWLTWPERPVGSGNPATADGVVPVDGDSPAGAGPASASGGLDRRESPPDPAARESDRDPSAPDLLADLVTPRAGMKWRELFDALDALYQADPEAGRAAVAALLREQVGGAESAKLESTLAIAFKYESPAVAMELLEAAADAYLATRSSATLAGSRLEQDLLSGIRALENRLDFPMGESWSRRRQAILDHLLHNAEPAGDGVGTTYLAINACRREGMYPRAVAVRTLSQIAATTQDPGLRRAAWYALSEEVGTDEFLAAARFDYTLAHDVESANMSAGFTQAVLKTLKQASAAERPSAADALRPFLTGGSPSDLAELIRGTVLRELPVELVPFLRSELEALAGAQPQTDQSSRAAELLAAAGG